MISTGIKYLDKITGGLRLGDNVVWQISDAVPIEYFIKTFFFGPRDFDKNIIYVNFNYSAQTVCRRYDELFRDHRVILIDGFTHGKGKSDPVFLEFYEDNSDYDLSGAICLKNPRDIQYFISILNEVQLNNKEGCFYIFDSLTGMNELWRDERAVLDFFGFTCPKLYDLNTLAYWMYEREAHSKEFTVGLTHITQVVFSVYKSDPDFFNLNILKLEDRPSFSNTGPHPFKVIDKKIQFQVNKTEDNFRIGEKLKELRKAINMTQAELASTLRMTPGAISQIEHEVISPSLHTLIQISSIFNKPLEYFINIDENGKRGYRVYKSDLHDEFAHPDAYITKLAGDDITTIKPLSVTIKSKKYVKGPLLLHKGNEFITVVKGAIHLTIEGEEHFLERGDSILLSASFVEKWHNKGTADCELFYILLE